MGIRMHALITGGSSGIGKSLANKLAAEGYDVSLIARRPQLLAQAAEEIRGEVEYDVRTGCLNGPSLVCGRRGIDAYHRHE